MPEWVKSRSTLRSMINFVIIHAPEFPREKFLSPEEQLTLDVAFRAMEEGLRFVEGLPQDAERVERLKLLLSRAKSAYAKRDRRAGGLLMQEVEMDLFGGPPRR